MDSVSVVCIEKFRRSKWGKEPEERKETNPLQKSTTSSPTSHPRRVGLENKKGVKGRSAEEKKRK